MQTRACKICGGSGPFYESNLATCKECVKARVRGNRRARIEYCRAYDRLRFYENGPRGKPSNDASKRAKRAWLARNEAKRRAHIAANNAIRCGLLAKADADEEDTRRVVAEGRSRFG